MKQISCLALLALTAACTPQPQIQCPFLGIDVNNPDFFQNQAPQTIDSVYNCEMARSRNFYAQTDLKYQWNLWRRVTLREISPAMAQQQWIEFSTAQFYQRGQLDAARSASYRSYYGGGGSRHYSKPRKQYDHGRRSGGPAVPNLSGIPSLPKAPTPSAPPVTNLTPRSEPVPSILEAPAPSPQPARSEPQNDPAPAPAEPAPAAPPPTPAAVEPL